jgi:hypothetical protein
VVAGPADQQQQYQHQALNGMAAELAGCSSSSVAVRLHHQQHHHHQQQQQQPSG